MVYERIVWNNENVLFYIFSSFTQNSDAPRKFTFDVVSVGLLGKTTFQRRLQPKWPPNPCLEQMLMTIKISSIDIYKSLRKWTFVRK